MYNYPGQRSKSSLDTLERDFLHAIVSFDSVAMHLGADQV